MTKLDEFIKAHTLSLRRAQTDANPDPARCLRVQRVARRSIAADAGIAPSDLVVLIDGKPAGQVGDDYWVPNVPQRRYTFRSHATGERVDLTATGLELGMECRQTAEAIVQNYRGDPSDLFVLWEDNAWKTLIELASMTLTAAARETPGDDVRNDPALTLLGAALWEVGAKAQGMQLMAEYSEQYAQSWTMNFSIIHYYYYAKERLAQGDRDDAMRVLGDAWARSEATKIADLLEEISGQRPAPAVLWRGRRFPVNYTLPAFDGASGNICLWDRITAMPEDKLLMICMLGSYRANGPYNSFMQKFVHSTRWFGNFLQELHVITMDTQRRADRAYWFQWEDYARSKKLPFWMLYDGNGATTESISPSGSPFIMMLDRKGTVVYEGWFDLIDLWDTIAAM